MLQRFYHTNNSKRRRAGCFFDLGKSEIILKIRDRDVNQFKSLCLRANLFRNYMHARKHNASVRSK